MTEKITIKAARPMSTKEIIDQLTSLKAHCSCFTSEEDQDPDHQVWRDDVAALDAALEVLRALDPDTVGNAKMAKAAMDLLRSQGQEINQLRGLLRRTLQKYVEGAPPVLQRKHLGTVYLCPECHKSIGKNHSHCHRCGKRIQWPESKGSGK